MASSRLGAAIAAAAALLAAPPATAETGGPGDPLPPFARTLDEGASAAYPFLRCSGLHFATILWSGEKKLGEQTLARLRGRVAFFNVLALTAADDEPGPGSFLERARRNGAGEGAGDPDREGLREKVLSEVNAFADAYLARWRVNYAEEGEPWSGDPGWRADQAICLEIEKAVKRG